MATMTSGYRSDQLSWSVVAMNEAMYSARAAKVPFACRMERASSTSASHYHIVVVFLAFEASSDSSVWVQSTMPGCNAIVSHCKLALPLCTYILC